MSSLILSIQPKLGFYYCRGRRGQIFGGSAVGLWHSYKARKWQNRVLKSGPLGSNPVFLHLTSCPSEYEAPPRASRKPCWEGMS